MRPARAKATAGRHPEIQHRHLSVSQLATRRSHLIRISASSGPSAVRVRTETGNSYRCEAGVVEELLGR